MNLLGARFCVIERQLKKGWQEVKRLLKVDSANLLYHHAKKWWK
jgi:hypothetical protein